MSEPLPFSEQPIVVQKYGGSSVADSEHLRRVAARIVATRESGKRVVVVVSAMAKATDDLLCRAREVADSPSRRELDMLLSCGERASMALLAMAVHELGHEAVSLTGSQSGIMTNDRHSGARIIDVRPVRVVDELERGKIVIVAGFQGVSYKREITTLGRGGSDTTAVALAAALGAEYCEICSDVKGVYTADPRTVEAAELLEAIRADEMLELAAHGAKVLHAECVEIALQQDIKLYARATSEKGGGTRIDRIGGGVRNSPVGISVLRGLIRLEAESRATLFTWAKKHAIEVQYFKSEGSQSELWFSLDDVPDWTHLRSQMLAAGDIVITEPMAMISIVGHGFGARASSLLEVEKLIKAEKLSPIRLESTPLRITLYCKDSDLDGLVTKIHSALIEMK